MLPRRRIVSVAVKWPAQLLSNIARARPTNRDRVELRLPWPMSGQLARQRRELLVKQHHEAPRSTATTHNLSHDWAMQR